MASVVYYKFNSQRKHYQAPFTGHHISVFDLKRHILLEHHLKPNDLDLHLYDLQGTELANDDQAVMRGDSVLVKRLAPRLGGGRGSATRYVQTDANVGSSAVYKPGYASGSSSKYQQKQSMQGSTVLATDANAMPTSAAVNEE